MSQLEKSQEVKLFNDSEKTGEQFANYDPEEKWIIVTHDGSSISLSLENWEKLIRLSKEVING